MTEALAEYRNEALKQKVEIFHDQHGFADDPCMTRDEPFQFITVKNHRHHWGHEQVDNDELIQLAQEADHAFPVYAYVHSGTAFSLGRGYPFNCPWDAGVCGFILFSQKDIDHEWGGDVDKAQEYAGAFLNEYTNWCNGNVHGYVAKEYSVCDHGCEHDGEEVDSCWGFVCYHDDDWFLEAAGVMEYIGTYPDGEYRMKEGWEEA